MKLDTYTKILLLILFIGICLLLYPTLGDIYSSYTQKKAISEYVSAVEELDDNEYEQMLEDAHRFNREVIYPKHHYSILSEEEMEQYLSLLNLSSNGMMGYIDIPTIKTSLAVYHTTEEKFLQVGSGHLEASSLPVGGKDTHSALSGHRGLVSAKLFTGLNELVEGDIFTLHILKETLSYQVDQVKVVLPEQTQDIDITDGQDYCTLITCTPYGINSHRLLVRGHRIDNYEGIAERVPFDAMRIQPMIIIVLLIIPVLIYVLVKVIRRKGEIL